MKIVTTFTAIYGPFKNIEVRADRLRCEDTELPLSIIGAYALHEVDSSRAAADYDWDGVALTVKTPAAAHLVIPQQITMRQARLALLGAGLLSRVNAAIAALPEPDKSAAHIDWEYSAVVQRDSGLVPAMGAALEMTPVQIDALFVSAAAL